MIIWFVKRLLLPIIGIILAYHANDPDGELFGLNRKFGKRTRMVTFLAIAVLAVIFQGVIDYNDECDDNEEIAARQQRIGQLEEEIREARRELSVANSNLAIQSRSIGSLVYNIATSFEGKRRFSRCIDALAFIDAKIDYKPLICDDGVAVFGFSKGDDQLQSFYFYANSEVNEVLSGLPVGSETLDEKGRLVVQRDSELALALDKAFERALPRIGADVVSRHFALESVAEKMRIFFRYAYRARQYKQSNLLNKGSNDLAGWHITFRYDVSPRTPQSTSRYVELDMPLSDVERFAGLTMREFSERLLAYCRGRKIEPKVRPEDIGILQRREKNAEDERTFPYSPKRLTSPIR